MNGTHEGCDNRYERASLIVTSNKAFGRWGEVFGDDVLAAAMTDRLVHHAEVIALKGAATGSRTATSVAPPQPTKTEVTTEWPHFQPVKS